MIIRAMDWDKKAAPNCKEKYSTELNAGIPHFQNLHEQTGYQSSLFDPNEQISKKGKLDIFVCIYIYISVFFCPFSLQN